MTGIPLVGIQSYGELWSRWSSRALIESQRLIDLQHHWPPWKNVHLQIVGGSLIINGLFGAATRFRGGNP
jgi:hypothetical protein